MGNSTSDPTSSGQPFPQPQGILGFTGTRYRPTLPKQVVVTAHLLLIGKQASGFVTGACTGIDAIIGFSAATEWPDRRHIVFVPADRRHVDRWWFDFDFVEVYEMPPGSTYRERNQRIVDTSQRIVGYPIGAEDHPAQRRSGTWQTIRMARRDHVEQPIILRLDTL